MHGNKFIDPYLPWTKPFSRIFPNYPCTLDTVFCVDYTVSKNIRFNDLEPKIKPFAAVAYEPGVWDNTVMDSKMSMATHVKITKGNYTLTKEWRMACTNTMIAKQIDFQNSILKQTSMDKSLIYMKDCNNLTITNVILKFDLKSFPFTQGTITSISQDSVRVRIDTNFLR